MLRGLCRGHRIRFLTAFAFLPAVAGAVAESRHAELDAMIRDLHKRDLFHGACIVADGGGVIYEAALGHADRENEIGFTLDTPNDAASVAKTLTAAAVWKLQEEGLLDLDDAVQRHLPSFPYPEVTVRHLLSHSSGLPDYEYFEKTWEKGTVWSNERILSTLARQRPPLAFEPGTEFAYCGAAYDIAALVVSAVCGRSFDAFAREAVLAPLRMENAFVRPAMFADWPGTRTKGYRLRDGAWEANDAFDAEGMVGGANFYLSAHDLHRWSTSFLERPIFSQGTLAEGMRLATIGGRQSGLTLLNWYRSDDGNEAWYAGEHRAFSTRIYRNHAKHRSIVFTCNNTPPQWLIPALIRAINAILNGSTPEPLVAPEIKSIPRSERASVAGTYVLHNGSVALDVVDGNLFFTPEGGLRYRAFSVGGGIFYTPGHDTWLWFTPDLDLVASRVTGIETVQRHR